MHPQLTSLVLAALVLPDPSVHVQARSTASGSKPLELIVCSPGNSAARSGELSRLVTRTGKVAERSAINGDHGGLYPCDLALAGDAASVWIAQLHTVTTQPTQRACLQRVDLATGRELGCVWLPGEQWLSTLALDGRGALWGGLVSTMPPRLVKLDALTGSFTAVGELDAIAFSGLEFHGDELWAVTMTIPEPRFHELVRLDPTNAHVITRVRIQLSRRVTSLDITRSGRFLISACDVENDPDPKTERSGIYELDPATGAAKKLMGLIQTDPLVTGLQVLER